MFGSFGKGLCNTANSFYKTAGLLIVGPYALPTYYRRGKEKYEQKSEVLKNRSIANLLEYNLSDFAGYGSGLVAGGLAILVEYRPYEYAINHSNYKLFLIPVITTVLSMFYEKTRKKLIEQHKTGTKKV